jgi:O-antigen/teichoic acid export membrane protein
MASIPPVGPDTPPPDPPAPPADLRALDRPMVSSMAWTGAVKWSLALFTWVATIIVARLLAPEDYGLIGMAGILIGLIAIFSEFGLGITIVTLRDLTRTQIAQLNGLAVVLGVISVGLCALLAMPAGSFFRAPALPLVIVVLSGSFLISSLRLVPAALLQRDLQFRTLALIEGAQGLIQSVTTIGLAWSGFGYWALVFGPIVGQLVATTLVLSRRRAAMRVPRRRSLGPALTFTRHQITGTLAWYAYSNSDFLIAGRILGQASLGVYSIAFTLARAIPEKVSTLVVRVTPAFFSAVQSDPAALRRYLLRLTEYLAMLTFPALAGLALVAGDVVQLIGPQWEAAVLPLRLLAIFAAFEGVLQLVSRVLTAVRRSRFLMYDGLALAVIMPLGFLVGSRWGVGGIAAVWLVLYPVTRIPALRVMRAMTGLGIGQYLAAYHPAVVGCIGMAATVLGFQQVMPDWDLLPRIAAQTLTGAAAYAAVIGAVFPDRIRELRDVLRQFRGPAA